ncbi:long-chain-fatty-acid--CoA ligase 4 [Penaeus vannamei]|uniref:long-chain-fatty-acid--CoA ligase 4 n=1 Tax=Penaeus vannamei TaxID=6689 RepID=UPI00387F7A22
MTCWGEEVPRSVTEERRPESGGPPPPRIFGVRNEKGYWVQNDPGSTAARLKDDLQAAGVTTLPAILEHTARTLRDKPCMGTRELLARHRFVENGVEKEKLTLGEYSFLTHGEVHDTVVSFSKGLTKIDTGNSGRIALFAETCVEWIMAAMGCLRQGSVVVTVYPTLALQEIVLALSEAEVSVIITSQSLLGRTAEVFQNYPGIKHVIVFEDQLVGLGTVPEVLKGVAVTPFKDVVEAGECLSLSLPQPTGSDVAVIMYTSGSVSSPKGVQLTHNNILSSVVSYIPMMDFRPNERFLAFLPLSHVMEFCCLIGHVWLNNLILFGSPMTLTSRSPKVMEGSLGDVQVAKPTYMNAVPLILDRVVMGVNQAVAEKGFLATKMFKAALALKRSQRTPAFVCEILDALVFKQIATQLGGNLRIIAVGGSPLCAETQVLMRALFGCVIQVGYGASETAACITATDGRDLRTGHCGAPCHGVQLGLLDWDECSYRITDKPFPRGEVIVAGPCVSKGYFKRPEDTQRVFIEIDGQHFFCTGDIAQIDDTGVVRIIDRKKDIVKLNDGEYIAVGRIEMKMKTNPFVDNIFVYVRPGSNRCICIVVANAGQVMKLGQELNLDLSFEDLCQTPEVVANVLQRLQAHGLELGLTKRELPVALYLTPSPWTPETGLVGPALKIRRKVVEAHFRDQIDAMYNNGPEKTR